MFAIIKQFKNYWFPSAEYIAESFLAKKEFIFWRGFVIATKEEDILPKGIVHDKYISMVGLHYFGRDNEFHEVVFLEDFVIDKIIRSNINDSYPKFIKKAAELILENYARKN